MLRHKKYSNLLQFESLNKYDSLLHFTTTIDGGVSSGEYASFNLGMYSGDNLGNVVENKNRLAVMLDLPSENLIFPYQTHGDSVCVIDKEFISKNKDEQQVLLNGVDALITNEIGVCIGVSTADCVPILIYDPKNNILAAIHAGWRGTVAKLAQKVVHIMQTRFNSNPADLIVGIAPSISVDYFEVGNEVVAEFSKIDFLISNIGFYNSESGKYHIDLWLANKLLLEQSGVCSCNIDIADLCTHKNADKFFSARRQGIKSGRFITGGILID